jgi:hypothetical protein
MSMQHAPIAFVCEHLWFLFPFFYLVGSIALAGESGGRMTVGGLA